MSRLPISLANALSRHNALKIISGLQNFDRDSVKMVVQAADRGSATFVDIAADAELIAIAKANCSLPICVSAVDAHKLAEAVANGADLVEIGNYDSFYAQGRIFTADEIIALTAETRALLPNTAISVTIPHTLPLDEQVTLAEKLEAIGVDIIQTEGGTSSAPVHAGVLGAIEKASPTLAAAHAISRAVSIPVLCASGLSNITAPMAIAAGASGVGIGSAVNQLNDVVSMIATVRALREALAEAINSNVAVKSKNN
jgi:thiamine monophosphate synthase